jgi:hypothetical protein
VTCPRNIFRVMFHHNRCIVKQFDRATFCDGSELPEVAGGTDRWTDILSTRL